jgi:hypothetical protein
MTIAVIDNDILTDDDLVCVFVHVHVYLCV